MKAIDKDKLYRWIKAECNPYGKPTINYEEGCKVLNIIERQLELPTMQSNSICDYCAYKKEDLSLQNTETNICWECGIYHQWCMFKGKEVIEVKE